ncbi:hypothetical protein [Paenibacillus amylolyticus]|uniref:hypothetical protein n=1 Tax=Paenibacillus amylolyticus TaxID=1451 RepID=UPI003D975BDF
MKQIKARCIDGFQEFNQGQLTCEVNDGEELVAELHEESEEYFSTDSKGREVYVGCLDMNGTLELDDCFELVEEGADTE